MATDKKTDAKKDAAPKEVKKPRFTVAEGKATTSKVGILGPGDEATPECFAGGEKTFRNLVEKKFIQENK